MSRHFCLLVDLDHEQDSFVARSVDTRVSAGQQSDPWTAEVEQLVTRLYRLPGSPAAQVVLFMALESQSSLGPICSYASERLASQLGASVCLIDASHYESSERQGLSKRRCLSDLLVDQNLEVDKVVEAAPGAGYYLFTCSKAPARRLLCHHRFPNCLSQLRTMFDFLLINVPLIRGDPSALAIAPLVDGVVLGLEAHRTRGRQIRRLAHEFESAGTVVLGTILTGRTLQC